MISICFFFFNDTATTEIYTLSLHDALPIFRPLARGSVRVRHPHRAGRGERSAPGRDGRSEEHTSELQSLAYLVCRLLLEKKKEFARSGTQSYHVEISGSHVCDFGSADAYAM